MREIYRPIAIMLIACFTVSSSGLRVSAQTDTITCSSVNRNYQYCRADTQNRVRLVNKISASDCVKDYSWGYDYQGVWVDRGCQAEFEVGGSSGDGGGGGHAGRNTAIAAGVIGAIIAGAAIASSRSKDNNSSSGGGDSQSREYYDDGYRLGQKDHDEGGAANVSIWSNSKKVPSRYEGDFDAGYDDGYNNRRRRY